MSHEDIKAISKTYLSMLNEGRDYTVAWKVPGRSRSRINAKVNEINGMIEALGVDTTDLSVNAMGRVTLVMPSKEEADIVLNALDARTDLVDPISSVTLTYD
jgi:hypothetical protein